MGGDSARSSLPLAAQLLSLPQGTPSPCVPVRALPSARDSLGLMSRSCASELPWLLVTSLSPCSPTRAVLSSPWARAQGGGGRSTQVLRPAALAQEVGQHRSAFGCRWSAHGPSVLGPLTWGYEMGEGGTEAEELLGLQ